MKRKPYVGLIKGGKRETFRSPITPTETDFPQYFAVIGPFRTIRGAKFMELYGNNNPHCLTVAQAEKLAKNEKNLI